jgi:hypothetical protein
MRPLGLGSRFHVNEWRRYHSGGADHVNRIGWFRTPVTEFPSSAPVAPNDRGFFLSNRGGEITDDGENQL